MFSKNKERLETLMQTVWIFNQNLEMGLVLRNAKRL